ncbi:MAG: type I-A CRISPR-associated protein Cas4/Csa1 [Chloroflexota bacterium]|jgi:CRISPR-associated protein Csa1
MYFLSDEERRYVLRKLLPESRKGDVHPELRGWNWAEPPLAPAYDIPLGVSEIAGRYCGTSRDLYMKRVVGVKAAPNVAMLEGWLLHRAVADQLLMAMRIIYTSSIERMLQSLEALRIPKLEALENMPLSDEKRSELRGKVMAVADFEYRRIVTRVADVLSRQPRVGNGGLAALALPVTVELPLDGRFLGLSSHLSADAVSLFEPLIVDLKFGEKRDFHRLATTGYALVMESLYECPINLGCVIYVKIEGGRISLDRDFHLIDDELRQWFVEARDENMRMLSDETDPGRPVDCYETCPYWDHCRS